MAVAISILVGTMTGNAELVADAVRDVLAGAGHPVEILPMDSLRPDVFGRGGVFLICTSTYGQGDVPDNARDLYEALQAEKPDLGAIRYGVIGLGDSTYQDTYNNGGKLFDTLLAGLGASRVGARMEHNASGGSFAEDDAVEWAKGWIGALKALTVAA
ncbi:flavodoxin domain-containing protein [Desertibaculum subflavum]|uniref:flavodoxin domain-containing protein n=1 Tax=Desertibaculum subflavum TaxID=2268458 RepID=UPI000E668A77